MNETIVAVLGLALLFLVYALLTAGRKHRPCTRCLEDEDAPRCDSCPLSRLDAAQRDDAERTPGRRREGGPSLMGARTATPIIQR